MKRILKYFPDIILILIMSHSSCGNIDREIIGEWENISIENPSPFFKTTLLTHEKGEIVLMFFPDGNFSWINTKEKTNITGKFKFSGNNLYLNNEKEPPPLKTEYKFKDGKLIIITDDGFSFSFLRKTKQ